MNRSRSICRLLLLLVGGVVGLGWKSAFADGVVEINVRSDEGRPVDWGHLAGGNLALWFDAERLEGDEVTDYLQQWNPGLMRIPGGSWSDEFVWNGHGVKKGDDIDSSKLVGGRWQIDYSDYAPGFRLQTVTGEPREDGFHGNVDIRYLHEFAKKLGTPLVVTVNAGFGDEQMAAEWVRFAKANDYEVAYWEVGNELDGEWELGHFGPDGEKMTGEKYAQRFLNFARAMKEVDPSIKVGGPTCSNDRLPFVEDLIRIAGEELDFVSFHTYPVEGEVSRSGRFAAAGQVQRAVKQIEGWVEKYVPNRKGEIEIGVTEWNKQVMETEHTVDLESGLWTALFLGELAKAGADFANHWDLFSTTKTGGHGLFAEEPGHGPRAAARVMAFWCQEMGDEWLPVEGGSPELQVYATRKDGNLCLAILNSSASQARQAKLSLNGEILTGTLSGKRFSDREYFWNPFQQKPEWSFEPSSVALSIEEEGELTLPPSSLHIFTVGANHLLEEKKLNEPQVELLLPTEAEVGLKARGFVLVRQKNGEPWPGKAMTIELSASEGVTLEPSRLKLNGPVGEFQMESTQEGKATLMAKSGERKGRGTMQWRKVEQRPVIVWEFDSMESLGLLESDFTLELDRGARPNRAVLAVSFPDTITDAGTTTLIAPKELKVSGEKEDIRGVVGYLGGSSDLACADPDAAVQVVIQSNLNHWILVGRIPLKSLKGEWDRFAFSLQEEKDFQAMEEAYSVRLQLGAKEPVTGRIYVGELGFLMEG